jgi:hypothetical protein
VTRAAAVKIGLGGALLLAYGLQVITPASVFRPPFDRFLGLPVVPAWVLGLTMTLFTAGGILVSEGICDAAGASSLWRLVSRNPVVVVRLLAGGAVAGIVLEAIAQWLGRLWHYPYWTGWFYVLTFVPGFVFYWLLIVESYLAAKAVLDALARPRSPTGPVRVWPLGAVTLLVALVLSLYWYAHRGGFDFAITSTSPAAPPFAYALLAVIGVTLLSRPLMTAVVRGYWVPMAAIAIASILLSVAMEFPNVHSYWAYAHFPGPLGPGHLPLSMFLAWPLQYLVFLAVPGAVLPVLNTFFWRPAD